MSRPSDRILVTGAAGFVGRAVADVMIAEGRDCLRHRREICGLASLDAVRACYGSMQFGAIVHVAGRMPSETGGCLEDFFCDNVLATHNVLTLLPQTGLFVFLSTVDVYGPPRQLPITESHPTEPVTDYAISKLAAEKLVQARAQDAGVPHCILRLSHVYGVGDRPIKLIPKTIEQVACGEAPIINGDGADLRDYIHVRDAARAIAAAVERRATGVFNVATGRSVSVVETVQAIMTASERPLQPRFRPRLRPQMDFRFNVGRLTEAMGFRPQEDFNAALRELCALRNAR